MHLTEAVEHVVAALATRRSPATVSTYATALRQFVDFCSNEEVFDVEHLHVSHFIAFTEVMAVEWGYSARTRTVKNSAVKHLLNWLVVHSHLELSPADDIRYKTAIKEYAGKVNTVLKLPKREHVDWTVEAAVKRSADQPTNQLAARDAALLSFLRATGCRVGEVLTLVVDDFDISACTATVWGKGGKPRVVLFDGTKSHLEHYWELRQVVPREHAFNQGFPDVPLTAKVVRSIVKRAKLLAAKDHHLELYGVRLTPHMFRHSFASEMLERTGNLAAVQDLLGHASPATTRIYAKLSTTALRKAYDEGI